MNGQSVAAAGSGTQTLSGLNTYSGNTVIDAGSTLQLGNGYSDGSVANRTQNGVLMTGTSSGAVTLSSTGADNQYTRIAIASGDYKGNWKLATSALNYNNVLTKEDSKVPRPSLAKPMESGDVQSGAAISADQDRLYTDPDQYFLHRGPLPSELTSKGRFFSRKADQMERPRRQMKKMAGMVQSRCKPQRASTRWQPSPPCQRRLRRP